MQASKFFIIECANCFCKSRTQIKSFMATLSILLINLPITELHLGWKQEMINNSAEFQF